MSLKESIHDLCLSRSKTDEIFTLSEMVKWKGANAFFFFWHHLYIELKLVNMLGKTQFSSVLFYLRKNASDPICLCDCLCLLNFSLGLWYTYLTLQSYLSKILLISGPYLSHFLAKSHTYMSLAATSPHKSEKNPTKFNYSIFSLEAPPQLQTKFFGQ